MIDNNEHNLTNERLTIYKRNRKINIVLLIVLFILAFLKEMSFFGELVIAFVVIVSLWFACLLLTKQTAYHLKREELTKAKEESNRILESVSSKNSSK